MLGLAARPELNGRIGKVQAWVASKGRYAVALLELDTTQAGSYAIPCVLGIKRDNLRLLSEEYLGASQELPELTIELKYSEISMHFSGLIRLVNGAVVDEKQGAFAEYHGEDPEWDHDDEF